MNRIKTRAAAIVLIMAVVSCSNRTIDRKDAFITGHQLLLNKVPLFIDRENLYAAAIHFTAEDSTALLQLRGVELELAEGSDPGILSGMTVLNRIKVGDSIDWATVGESSGKSGMTLKVTCRQALAYGENMLAVRFNIINDAPLDHSLEIKNVTLIFSRKPKLVLEPAESYRFRPGIVLRAAGQDNCDTYRIPGIITTGNGTLIAVYDNRYNNSKDLQEDVDVGMSRSTDGGQTWEPMRVIMDMGEWGGRPERLNGIGDPSILYDHTTGTIWVAALWISGFSEQDMLWWASQPGMNPEETGQFMLVKSTDDGLTWSEPVNITKQIKDPAWQLLFQGPGAGITLNDGTLIFPAQFKADIGEKALDGGQYTSHSTIVYSTNGGENWQVGTGAKPNTTESQVVQLGNGSLMLNMRDDRNRSDKGETNGRAVAVTNDMGKTWVIHPSSNSALPEPNCMASIIATDVLHDDREQQVLFFSNPNSKTARTNMTIKASLDDGNTWPEGFFTELYAPAGFGYSCLTMVDENTVGIVYEGIKDLYFQKVPVSDILEK